MLEISITDDQHEQQEEIRRDVESAFVDTYRQVRLEDAIEYLLDTYTPPDKRGSSEAYNRIASASYPELQRVASDVSAVPGSGISADEMRGKLLAKLGPNEFSDRLDSVIDGDGDSDRNREATSDDRTEQDTDGDGTVASGMSATETDPDAAGGTLLGTANRLLREHDDKWHEGSETPFEVDLPDGTTEPVRTKDDVRELLFRHY